MEKELINQNPPEPMGFKMAEASWFYAKWGKSGIYGILDLKTNKIYIGSAVNISHRKHCHFSDLKLNKHGNRYLQRAYNVRPFDFEHVLIELVNDKKDLIKKEQFWINFFDSATPQKGFNLNPTASSRLGATQSIESRAKISAALVGRVFTEETRKKLSDSQKLRFSNPKNRMMCRQYGLLSFAARNTEASRSKRTATHRASSVKRIGRIKMLNKDKNETYIFDSITDASKALGIGYSSIHAAIGRISPVFGKDSVDFLDWKCSLLK